MFLPVVYYLIHHFFWQELLSCTWLSFIALPRFPQAKHVYITTLPLKMPPACQHFWASFPFLILPWIPSRVTWMTVCVLSSASLIFWGNRERNSISGWKWGSQRLNPDSSTQTGSGLWKGTRRVSPDPRLVLGMCGRRGNFPNHRNFPNHSGFASLQGER